MLKIRRHNITLLKTTKNVINSKTYLFLIASNLYNKMITKDKLLEERHSVPLIQNSYKNFNEEPFQQV